jgi:hypothetical protein
MPNDRIKVCRSTPSSDGVYLNTLSRSAPFNAETVVV